ncbi:MAG: N-acetylneuraminate synthase family protein [Bdellovibrionales bacterium]|nr:N-acetylneuraminate synthase family protein [Bdellovibrionales bacterium]
MKHTRSRTSFSIGPHTIGAGSPTFVIAEIGINHNGSLERAKALIDAARLAGASAVKFQKRELDSIYQHHVFECLEHYEQGFQYLIPILKDFELTASELRELKQYCDREGMLFLCTPFDVASADLLESLDVAAYKVSSADLTNLLLLERLAGFNKPLIISTGMSSEEEVDRTVDFLETRNVNFALLHCVSSYPVNPCDAKLQRITALLERYDCPIGYSGHDLGTALSMAARALGACIIEKHITLDRSLRGPDHKLSLLPEELVHLIAGLRDCDAALAAPREHLLPAETLNQLVFRKSVAAKVAIKSGQVITREMLTVKSPGSGLNIQDIEKLVGRTVKRSLQADDLFLPSDIGQENGQHPIPPLPWGRWGFVVRYHDFEETIASAPRNLEFHLTYRDTKLPVPHERLSAHTGALKQIALRVHCCEYVDEGLFDLCSESREVVARSQETLQRVIDITAELAPYFSEETPRIIFNCGAMSMLETKRGAVNVERFIEAIRALELKGTRLLAQNMPPNPWYFGGQWRGHYLIRPSELVHFCKATGHGLCLDLSHAHMACRGLGMSMAAYLEKLKPYVEHVHLSDARSSEGEGLQIGQGEIDFLHFFVAYSDFQGTWIPEIWLGHVNHNRGAKEALELLAELQRKADQAAHAPVHLNGANGHQSSRKTPAPAPLCSPSHQKEGGLRKERAA